MRFAALPLGILLSSGVSFAQPASEPEAVVTEAPRTRPTFSVAVGLGWASAGFETVPTTATPATKPTFFGFFADGEIAGNAAGFLARMVALTGEGNRQVGYDEIALTGALSLRPLAWRFAEGEGGYGARLARRAALEVGYAFQRGVAGPHSSDRHAVHLGAHFDLLAGGIGDRGLFWRFGVARRLTFSSDAGLSGVAICATPGAP
jgi:hypothetical protein